MINFGNKVLAVLRMTLVRGCFDCHNLFIWDLAPGCQLSFLQGWPLGVFPHTHHTLTAHTPTHTPHTHRPHTPHPHTTHSLPTHHTLPTHTLHTHTQHHCRNCGGIFCYACSDNSVQLPSSAKPVRVCNSCQDQVLQRAST